MKIQQKLGASVLSLGLVVGLSGFAGATSGTIDTTGPDSDNHIRSRTTQRVDIDNNNKLDVRNDNHQRATTGEAEVEGNTRGGDAESGSAENENDLNAAVSVDNSVGVGAWADAGGNGGGHNHSATIENTGPKSDNTVRFETRSTVEIENKNDLKITNNNTQTAKSGDAEVEGNTTGGSATSGDASNTNSTTIRFDITN